MDPDWDTDSKQGYYVVFSNKTSMLDVGLPGVNTIEAGLLERSYGEMTLLDRPTAGLRQGWVASKIPARALWALSAFSCDESCCAREGRGAGGLTSRLNESSLSRLIQILPRILLLDTDKLNINAMMSGSKFTFRIAQAIGFTGAAWLSGK